VGKNAGSLRAAGYCDLAESLESFDLNRIYSELEPLEQDLTAIEEKMIACLRDAATEEALSEGRRALDRDLKPYRGKMTPDQLAKLEKQFLARIGGIATAQLVLSVNVSSPPIRLLKHCGSKTFELDYNIRERFSSSGRRRGRSFRRIPQINREGACT